MTLWRIITANGHPVVEDLEYELALEIARACARTNKQHVLLVEQTGPTEAGAPIEKSAVVVTITPDAVPILA
jgi:hypothetical protein